MEWFTNTCAMFIHYLRDYYTSQQDQTQLIEYNRDIPGTTSAIQCTNVPTATTVNVAQFSFSGNFILEMIGIIPNPLFITNFTRSGEGFTAPSIFNASPDIPSISVSGYTGLTATPLNFKTGVDL
jgi:hypothetical protein